MHAAAFLSVTAVIFKDQLNLRVALLVSILLSTAYHLFKIPEPAWQEVFWNVVTFIIGLGMAVRVLLDRTHFGLSDIEEQLFAAFAALSPGEFRRLVRAGRWRRAEGGAILTREGEPLDRLFYVLEGEVRVRKGEREFVTPAQTFIGEIAFLHDTPASATVTAAAGALYYEWPVGVLHRHLGRRGDLEASILRVIGLDMAMKVARS